MSTSQHTLEQVRSILSKLDRDIDAARERRLRTHPGRSLDEHAASIVAPSLDDREIPNTDDDPGKSGYGKARPLRRD